jgi:hypothetical protein
MKNDMSNSSILSDALIALPKWYYPFVLLLIVLSLVSLSRNVTGEWEITLGVQEITVFLVALIILPILVKFFRGYEKGGVKLLGVEANWERKSELDNVVTEAKQIHEKAGKFTGKLNIQQDEIENKQKKADNQLAESLNPQELPIYQSLYMKELYQLASEFNRNRRSLMSDKRTFDGDAIAYRMRAISPLLFGQINLDTWLNSSNPGKRLAAIKYIDWLLDIEYADKLSAQLLTEEPFFQFHIMLALSKMVDQLPKDNQEKLKTILSGYNLPEGSNRGFWKQHILSKLDQ